MNILKLFCVLFFSLALFNCSKEEYIPKEVEVQDFVWKGMNAYYYWQSDVPDLADRRFTSQKDLTNFLSGFPTPESLFEAIRYQPGVVDRFSVIVDDYIALENLFQGITLNNGMEFKLYRYNNSQTTIYGVVYYVIPGSNAASNGVTRGLVFNTVDGTQLTETNYRSLLFGANSNYTIGTATYNNGAPAATGVSIALSKEQLQENPVAITKVFEEGTAKVGYLLYNQFVTGYDDELNTAFANLKSQGITDLIVDLRYNGGGSVRTATYLGSMITGQFNNQLYSQEVWNEKVIAAVKDGSTFLNNFTNQINNGQVNEPINSLNLSRVYFIVTDNTASASELVINALSAYIKVTLVGEKTVGKQVGSVTLYDSDNLTRTGANLNQNHTFAMQPIVLEIKNANGENDANGYVPDLLLAEDFGQISGAINLGVLGEKSDPLVANALSLIINGAKISSPYVASKPKESVSNSKFSKPFSQEMFVQKLKK